MQSIEFKTKSSGGMIPIPETQKDWYDTPMTVILLRETKPQPFNPETETLTHFFEPFNADLTGYRFNREEANER
jgi:hypothetical protein